jgi:hypothetical protein
MPRRSVGPFVLLLLISLYACGGAPTPTIAPSPAIPPTFTPVPRTPTAAPTPTLIPLPTATATTLPPSPTPTIRPAVTPGTAAASDVLTDPKGRFAFTKPQGWMAERQTDTNIVVQLNSDRPPGSFIVSTEIVPTGISLAQYVEAGVTQVRKDVPGYEPGPRGTQATTLGNEPAGLIDYFTTAGGTKLYFVQVIAVKGDTAYVLTFNTQPADKDAYLAQAQTILDSWRFL